MTNSDLSLTQSSYVPEIPSSSKIRTRARRGAFLYLPIATIQSDTSIYAQNGMRHTPASPIRRLIHHSFTSHPHISQLNSITTMPRAARKKTNTAATDAGPTSKPKTKHPKEPKDPKLSHLYTDDNPATTIHGTGFKDAAAAHNTFELISKRSLLYQFQTINTMFHRANGHPNKNKDMEAAMGLFREWLDVTYPEAMAGLRLKGFKPLLSKDCVRRYLPQIRKCKLEGMEKAVRFAEKYVDLPPRKKLANVLFDDSAPREPDMEKVRYDRLDELVADGKETSKGWDSDEVWAGKKQVTDEILRLIAWAWAPIQERNLP